METFSIGTAEANEYINLIIAGFLATFVMTILMYISGFISKKNMAVVHILGSMITFRTNSGGGVSNSFFSLFSGCILHFLVGIVYAFVYSWLWYQGIGIPDFINSIIFGAVTGLIATAGWKIFINIHPNPPHIPTKEYLVTIFLTHIIFAIILFYVYLVLTRYPLPIS
ncbi:hypothetical protein BH23BAC1_BH23BAC1_09500 [soil metagenome]